MNKSVIIDARRFCKDEVDRLDTLVDDLQDKLSTEREQHLKLFNRVRKLLKFEVIGLKVDLAVPTHRDVDKRRKK